MDILDVLQPKCCSATLSGRTKDAVLAELAQLALRNDQGVGALTATDITKHLQAREAQGSTAYGGGIAIPHARIPGLNTFIVVIGISSRGVDFDAMDNKRVRIFAMIIGPADQPQAYLKLLAALSRLLMNVRLRKELLRATTAVTVHETLVRWHRFGTPSAGSGKQVLMTIILYEENVLHQLLGFLVERGVEGATILESHGMNEYISQVPLYAEMIQFMSVRKSQSKTILILVPEEAVDDLIEGVEEITGNLDQVEGAVIFVQDVRRVRGTMRMME